MGKGMRQKRMNLAFFNGRAHRSSLIFEQVLNRIRAAVSTADCADDTDGKERHERQESSHSLSASSAVELFPNRLRR